MKITDKDPFVEFKDGGALEAVLYERLPESANIYNLICMSSNNPIAEVHWYSLHGETSSKAWVLVSAKREDIEVEYMISSPKGTPVTPEIHSAFGSTSIFNWDKKYMFIGLDSNAAQMIYDLSVKDKGNTTMVVPCWQLYMTQDDALAFALDNELPPGVTLKPLQGEQDTKFITGSWKWKMPRTEEFVERMLRIYPSVGVHLNGELVSGIITKAHGCIGFSYTVPEQRSRGFGKIGYKAIIRQWLGKKWVPCVHIEINNVTSLKFHERLGFKVSHRVDYFKFSHEKY